MSQLTIYKASAGSGKTFRLTQEFLNLLFKHPENYRRILAVTFTNKATAEMKNRILSELNKLAKGFHSNYAETLKEEYNLSNTELQSKAGKILTALLHDFSKFSVSTIDKFFQKIIRGFTREIGIQPGYSIELNQSEILNKVIDDLLLDLDENHELRSWLSDLASENVEQGSRWDFKEDIQKLAREIFKEEYKAFDKKLTEKMNDKEFLKSYIHQLQEIKFKFENQLKAHASSAIELIKSNGLEIEDFKWGKSSVPNYFKKILDHNEFAPKARTLKGTKDYIEWINQKSDQKDLIENVLNKGLFDLLVQSVNYYEKNQEAYNTSIEILKFIHTLGILTDISAKLRDYTEEQNIFLISDAAQLIQIIIDHNDSPFIYEKTGSIYKHFMIDEFQDTSKIQWHNFKPLIGNSLAQGSKNLVVGDVKQSIYRWRNSDWEILAEKIQKDFAQFNPENQTLSTNWRSKKNIIDFNNVIFHFASLILQNYFNSHYEDERLNPNVHKISQAYEDVFQNIARKDLINGGYINHTFLDEEDFKPWEEEVKNRLPKIIENLQIKGYQLNDIAILVRTSREGQEIANALIEYKNEKNSEYDFDFISNDSLFLNNSSLVQFILSILEYILDPHDAINLSFIAFEYHQYLQNEELSDEQLHHILRNKKNDREGLENIFPIEFIESLEQIKLLPIYELIDRIIRVFKLNENRSELPYLKAFLDVILDFGKKSASDIHTFLNWWKEEGYKKTLSVSENQDAIRILTIHSAKGLEFKNVIIPFCSWSIDHKSQLTNILWCKPQHEPFNQLDLVPVKYHKELTNTIFKEDYLNEKFHAYVDNLNLLYVAFTRAEDNLFCFSPIKKKKDSMVKVSDLLYKTYQNHTNYPGQNKHIKIENYWSEEDLCFELGNLGSIEKESNALPGEFEIKKYESFDIKNKLRLKLHDNSFFTGTESASFEKVNYGKVMHEIFENIQTEQNISQAVDQLSFEGKISPDEKNTITEKIQEIFKNDQIKSWFSIAWRVRTEAEIILPNGKTVRPDRVISNEEKTIVIDYKFGEQEEEKHQRQVKHYIETISEMEDKKVEGYLWYVDLGNIVAVSSF